MTAVAADASAATARDRGLAVALTVITAAAVVRLVFAALIPAFPDEAYYWTWSRQLAAGYFDHPPVVALLIRAGDALLAPFGAANTPVAIRLGTVAAGWVAAFATVAIARELGGSSAARRGAVIMSVLPLAAAGLLLATPDAPVLAADAVALYCVVRASGQPVGSRASTRWWLAGAIALGAAFASKYTSIFVPVGVLVALASRRDLRARFREPGPYLACVVATLVFLPVLVWNAHHGWISFVFQIHHGLAAPHGSAIVAAFHHEGDFLGGQAGLASPIIFVLLGIAVARALRRSAASGEFVLGVVAVITCAFFLWSGVRQRVEPNWPAPMYVPAIALLAAMPLGRRGGRWYAAGLWLAVVVSIVIYVQGLVPVLPIKPPRDPIGRAFGWREVALRASGTAEMVSAQTQAVTWLGGDRYQEASELALEDPLHRPTFATNVGGRPNQYDLWPRFPDRARRGDNLVLVVDDAPAVPDAIKRLMPYFASVQRGPEVDLARGAGVVGTRRIWLLLRWRGGWPT